MNLAIFFSAAFFGGVIFGVLWGHALGLRASRAVELLHDDAAKWEFRCKLAEGRIADFERKLRARVAAK